MLVLILMELHKIIISKYEENTYTISPNKLWIRTLLLLLIPFLIFNAKTIPPFPETISSSKSNSLELFYSVSGPCVKKVNFL